MSKSDPARCAAAAFTLVELILVMALLALIMGLSAPSLSRSLRGRHLAEEATRFLALTEYARDEAVSQGVPMLVWVNAETGHIGVEAKEGFTGDEKREREFAVNPDVHLEVTNAATNRGVIEAVEFAPDGLPSIASAETVRFVDRFESAMTIGRTIDWTGYEIVKETK